MAQEQNSVLDPTAFVVGELDCSFERIIRVLKGAKSYHALMDKWIEIASNLEISQHDANRIKRESRLRDIMVGEILQQLLFSFRAKHATTATLDKLITALEYEELNELAYCLKKEFYPGQVIAPPRPQSRSLSTSPSQYDSNVNMSAAANDKSANSAAKELALAKAKKKRKIKAFKDNLKLTLQTVNTAVKVVKIKGLVKGIQKMAGPTKAAVGVCKGVMKLRGGDDDDDDTDASDDDDESGGGVLSTVFGFVKSGFSKDDDDGDDDNYDDDDDGDDDDYDDDDDY